MLLVCNSTESVGEVLIRWHPEFDPVRSARIGRLVPSGPMLTSDAILSDVRYVAGVEAAAKLVT